MLVDLLDHVGRRSAEGVGDEPDLVVVQRAHSSRGLPVASVHPIIPLRRWSSGGLGHAVLVEQTSGETAVVVGHHRLQLGLELHRVHLAHALVLAGDDDVDAVGVLADVLVEPVELDLELLGREADGAEHAESAGVGHRRDDVAAMGEGEDRELDAEPVADLGVHGLSPCVWGTQELWSRIVCRERSEGVRDAVVPGVGAAPVTIASADATSAVSRRRDRGGVVSRIQ